MLTPPVLERAGRWLAIASLGVVQFNLLTAQVCFGLAALAWAALALGERRRPEVPPFFVPLAAYAGLTLASAAASSDPVASVIDSRQLLLFLMVPVVARLVRGRAAATAMDVVIALGAAGAAVGIVEALLLGFDNLNRRPTGLLSHYMTYSGVLMLVTCAAAARLVYRPAEWVWPGIAVPALVVALGATFARNAWIGTVMGVTALLGLRNVKLLVAVPLLVGAALALAPARIQDRALSIFDRHDPTNRDRFAMIGAGFDMIRDHPALGVGPEMVQRVYGRYRRPDAVNLYNPHLHNVPVQIAAERGLPALAVWLWFIVAAARDLVRQLRRGTAPALAGAALAGVVAMLGAGLFEYNFGDSEFLMLFLGLLTLPWAAARAGAGPAPPAGA